MRERFASRDDNLAAHAACRRQLQPVLVDLVARAHAEGSLRSDVSAEDIALLLIGLGRIAEAIEDPTAGTWQRHLDLVLDGLHAADRAPTETAPPAQTGAPA